MTQDFKRQMEAEAKEFFENLKLTSGGSNWEGLLYKALRSVAIKTMEEAVDVLKAKRASLGKECDPCSWCMEQELRCLRSRLDQLRKEGK